MKASELVQPPHHEDGRVHLALVILDDQAIASHRGGGGARGSGGGGQVRNYFGVHLTLGVDLGGGICHSAFSNRP